MHTHSTCNRLHPFFIHKEEPWEAEEEQRHSQMRMIRARHATMPCICRVSTQPRWCFSLWRRAKHPLSRSCAPHKLKCSLCGPLLSSICAHVLRMHKNYEVEGFFFLPPFFFCPASVLNLLKVRTQRPLGTGQPTLQMARGSEAVSTLKRAKSRGFSPAGEDTAWIGYFHQPL